MNLVPLYSAGFSLTDSGQPLSANLQAVVLNTPPAAGAEGEQDFEYVQSTPAQVWVINHNLNRKVTTDVYTVGGQKVWAGVINLNSNQVQVELDEPMSGYAIIN